MPNSYLMQRTKLRYLGLAPTLQSDANVILPDAAFTRSELMGTADFAQITPKKESDYEYAGKGNSFASDIQTVEIDGSWSWGARLNEWNVGYLLAMVLGIDNFTPGITGGVATVPITNGGEGYVAVPAVTFTAAPAGGTTATATAVLTAGVVTAITITNPGSGYIAAPAVTIAAAPNGGTTATATSTIDTTPNQHVLTWADNTNPASLTNILLYDTTAIRRRFLDMALKTLVLTANESGSIKFKSTWIGTGRYEDGALAGALPALEVSPTYLRGSDAQISLGPTGGALASFYPRVRSWELTLDSGVEVQRRCGAGVYAAFISNGNPTMKLKLMLDADDTTDIRDYAENNTELQLKFVIPIGTAGNQLTLYFPCIVLPKDDLSEMASKYVGYTIELDEQNILKPVGVPVFTATLLNEATQYLQTYVG